MLPLVPVKIFSTVLEAEIARGFLESQGVQAHVRDRGAMLRSSYPIPADIELLVKPQDLDEARALLESPPDEPSEDPGE